MIDYLELPLAVAFIEDNNNIDFELQAIESPDLKGELL